MTDDRSESTAVSVVERQPLATIKPGTPVAAFVPTNFDEAVRIAGAIAVSGMAPKSYNNNREKILVGMMTGAEVGLTPMQSLRGVAVIGNQPGLWGDVALGVVLASGLLEDMAETQEGSFVPGGDGRAVCTMKRKGRPTPVTRRYDMERARKAKLLTKDGSWQTDPERMCQMRARAFTMRDLFPDVLSGLNFAEILEDDEASARARPETVAATADDLRAQAGEVPRGTQPLATTAAVEASAEADRQTEAAQRRASEQLMHDEAARVASKPAPKRRVRSRAQSHDETPNPPAPPADEGNVIGQREEHGPSHGGEESPASEASGPLTMDATLGAGEPEAPPKRAARPVDHMDRATYRDLVEQYEKEGRSDDQMARNARHALEKIEREVDFGDEEHAPLTGRDDDVEEAEFEEVDQGDNPAFFTREGYDLNTGDAQPGNAFADAVEHLKTLKKVSEVAGYVPDTIESFTPEQQMEFSSVKAKLIATLVEESRRR